MLEKIKEKKAAITHSVSTEQPLNRKPAGKNLFCRCCGNKDLDKVGTKNSFEFWECDDCGFIFTDVSYIDMVKTYQSGYHSVIDGAPKRGWASPDFLTPALAKLPEQRLNILDFGCGESRIPDFLREKEHKVVAVDIVPPHKPHPDRLTGDIMELQIPENSFDLIYSYQVFEHIAEPAKILNRLFQLLKKDGLLLIHTDMETSERRNAGDFLKWWYVLPPDHCSYFRHNTFKKMISKVGHRVIYRNPKIIMARK